MKITSTSNELVKNWSSLKLKKYRDETRTFLVEGEHLVMSALKKGIVLTQIYVNDLPSYFNSEIPTYEVTYQILEKITNTKTPQKVAAICSYLDKPSLKNKNKIIALDRVQDPGNGGTIVRTALAFDYDAILISEDSFDIYNDKFIRSTMGSFFDIDIIRNNLYDKLLFLKDDKYDIIVTILNSKSLDYKHFIPNNKFVLVLGNEGQGISKEIIDLSTHQVYIPISSKIDSLNVSIAGAICMAKFSEK